MIGHRPPWRSSGSRRQASGLPAPVVVVDAAVPVRANHDGWPSTLPVLRPLRPAGWPGPRPARPLARAHAPLVAALKQAGQQRVASPDKSELVFVRASFKNDRLQLRRLWRRLSPRSLVNVVVVNVVVVVI